jgi:hypothetical protein
MPPVAPDEHQPLPGAGIGSDGVLHLASSGPARPPSPDALRQHLRAEQVLAKFHERWAANHGSDRVYAAVRGDGERWHTILPWSMLAPMRQAKGYDDRLVLDGITRALHGCREYFKYGERLKRKVLSRDPPIEERYVDRIPRDELQRMRLS